MIDSTQCAGRRITMAFDDSVITSRDDDIGDLENFAPSIIHRSASGPSIWTILSSVVIIIIHKWVLVLNLH